MSSLMPRGPAAWKVVAPPAVPVSPPCGLSECGLSSLSASPASLSTLLNPILTDLIGFAVPLDQAVLGDSAAVPAGGARAARRG
jgi:hypothetical protein